MILGVGIEIEIASYREGGGALIFCYLLDFPFVFLGLG